MQTIEKKQEPKKHTPGVEQIKEMVLKHASVLSNPDNEHWYSGACVIVHQLYNHCPAELDDAALNNIAEACINFILQQSKGKLERCADTLSKLFEKQPYLLTNEHHDKLIRLLRLVAQLPASGRGQSILSNSIDLCAIDSITLFCAMVEKSIELKPNNAREHELTFYLTYINYILGRLIKHAAYHKLSNIEAQKLVSKYCHALFNLTSNGGSFIDRPFCGVMYYNDSYVLDPEFGMHVFLLIMSILEGGNYSEEKLTILFKIFAENTKAVVEDTFASYYKEFDRRTKDLPPKIIASIKEGRKEDERLFGKHNYSVEYSLSHGSVSSIITTLYRHDPSLFEDEELLQLSTRVSRAATVIEKASTTLDHFTFRILESTIHGEAHSILHANDERRERFLKQILALSNRLQHINNNKINLKKTIWCIGDDFNENSDDKEVINSVRYGVLRIFIRTMASIITIENESEYQIAQEYVMSLFLSDTEDQFLDNCVFADSIILPLTEKNSINLSDKNDWEKIASIQNTINQFNVPDDKKQIITRWFLKKVVSNYDFYKNTFSDLSELEHCCQIIAENTFEGIRILCDIVFAHFISERPECHNQIGDIFRQLRRLVSALKIAHSTVQKQEESSFEDFPYRSTFPLLLKTFLPMIFRINQDLELTQSFTDKIVRILTSISSAKEFRALKLILQYTPHINNIADILKKELTDIKEHPSRDQFNKLARQDQLAWLTYYSAMRVRQGLGALNHVLKNVNNYGVEELCAMLSAFSRIGINASHSKLKPIYQLLSHDNFTVRAHAATAIWFIDQNPDNKRIQHKLINDLIETKDSDYQIALLNTLSFYHYDQNDLVMWLAVVEKSRHITEPSLLKHYALALSRIPSQAGLLRALEIVNSPVWDEYNYCYNYHERNYGDQWFSVLMFLHTPHWWNNRALMIRRIKRLLVPLSDNTLSEIPVQRQDEVATLEKIISQEGCEIRYENMQLTLPNHTVLLRGICARHGDALERKAVIDFIMKGSSSTELQGHEDNKASHAASNNIYSASDFDVATSYYKQDSGILMTIKSEYFNQESYRGFTRTQIEGSRHYIFLRGVPLHAIEKMFFPQSYEHSLILLSGNTSVCELQNDETFEFRELDKHRLHQMRHSVRSFMDRIVFVHPQDSMPELLVRENCLTPTIEDITQTTIQEHIKGEMMAEDLGTDIWHYHMPESSHDFLSLFSRKHSHCNQSLVINNESLMSDE